MRERTRDTARRLARSLEFDGLIEAGLALLLLIVGLAAMDGSGTSLLPIAFVLLLLKGQTVLALSTLRDMADGTAALIRVQSLLALDPRRPYSGRSIPPSTTRICFERVGFGYGRLTLLKEISFTIEPGRCIALVGPNGSGKTTLVRQLLGLLHPLSGRLSLGDVSYEDLDLRQLRRRIGLVPQHPVLFAGSVAANITYGRPLTPDCKLQRAARLAGVLEFAPGLPKGLDTPLTEDGAPLSGGQRQRVAIARALLDEPGLLVFDEPANHLDERSLGNLIETLRSLACAPTILLVTHDSRLAELADKILILERGRLYNRTADEKSRAERFHADA